MRLEDLKFEVTMMHCKYCGRPCASFGSLVAHERSCAEMRYLANWVLQYSQLVGKKGVVGGVETDDPRILSLIRRAAQQSLAADASHEDGLCEHGYFAGTCDYCNDRTTRR